MSHSTFQICTTCTSCESHACACCAMTLMRIIVCRCAWHDGSKGERRQHEWQQDQRTGKSDFKTAEIVRLHCCLSKPAHIICEGEWAYNIKSMCCPSYAIWWSAAPSDSESGPAGQRCTKHIKQVAVLCAVGGCLVPQTKVWMDSDAVILLMWLN